MTEPLFDIVFRGDLMPGHHLPDVKARLAQLFKIDAARVEALFSGAAVTLKRNLDRPTASKYHKVLRSAGAAVDLRPARQEPAASATRRDAPRPAGLSLAPLGAELLSPQERSDNAEPELELNNYSIRPMEGYLLDEAERGRDDITAQVDYDFDLAPLGADLLDARPESEPFPELNPRFELAEPGADVLKPEERSRQEPVQVETDHISLVQQ